MEVTAEWSDRHLLTCLCVPRNMSLSHTPYVRAQELQFSLLCLYVLGMRGVGVGRHGREDKPNHTRLYITRSQLH